MDDELFKTLYSLVELNMMAEAGSAIFVYFDKNKYFYRKAFIIEGQNSFKEILVLKFIDFYEYVLSWYQLEDQEKIKTLTLRDISEYYTIGLVYLIKKWCEYDGGKYEVDDVIESYEYLVSHALTDIFEEK